MSNTQLLWLAVVILVVGGGLLAWGIRARHGRGSNLLVASVIVLLLLILFTYAMTKDTIARMRSRANARGIGQSSYIYANTPSGTYPILNTPAPASPAATNPIPSTKPTPTNSAPPSSTASDSSAN